MKITITQETIDAVRKLRVEDRDADKSFCCPVAFSLRPVFPGMDVFCSKWQAIGINPETRKGGHLNLPQEVTDFIWDFEAGRPVKPLSFNIK